MSPSNPPAPHRKPRVAVVVISAAVVVLVAGLLAWGPGRSTRGDAAARAKGPRAVTGTAGTGTGATTRTTTGPGGARCTVSVTSYGASTSSSDNAPAFQAAVDAGVGGTVCVPAGTFAFTSEVVIDSAEVLTGAGASATTLVETAAGHNLLADRADGTVVEDLTLDTQTHQGGIAFSTGASHVTLRDAHVRSGRTPGHFALYFAGPPGARLGSPVYSTGNVLEDVTVSDQICDDGVSWSFQRDGTIADVSETGSRLALYADAGTTVDGYRYTPGPCTPSDDGFWITQPASDITIEHFVSSGAAGDVCALANARPCSHVTIEDEVAPTGILHVGNVTGLTVTGSTVGGVVVFAPLGATGTWSSSRPTSARCANGPVAIAGLGC